MSQAGACLGAILLLLLAFIAYFAWARRSGRGRGRGVAWRGGFLSGGQVLYDMVAPAPPPARKAAARLYATLDQVVDAGERFTALADSLAKLGAAASQSSGGGSWLLGARQGVARVVAALRRSESALQAVSPTWQGYHAVYRGLAMSDGSFLCAARAYEAAGHQLSQQLGAAQLGRADSEGMPGLLPDSPYLIPQADADLAEAGALLVLFGSQLREVVRGTHQLGVTLDLE